MYKQAGGTGAFVALGVGNKNWRFLASTTSDDVYACVYGGDIYKQTGGTGAFVQQSSINTSWWIITSNTLGNIFICVFNGDIYQGVLAPRKRNSRQNPSPLLTAYSFRLILQT